MNASASHARSTPERHQIDRTRWVSIRPIERSDAPGLSDFYARLSTESRRLRFLNCGTRPIDDLARAFAQRDRDGFVGILGEPGPRDGAVVAHASVQADGHGGAEIAFAVADELQGRGIGRELMNAVVQHARVHGLRRLSAMLFAENAAMRQLLRGAGCPVVADRIDMGVEEITLAV